MKSKLRLVGENQRYFFRVSGIRLGHFLNESVLSLSLISNYASVICIQEHLRKRTARATHRHVAKDSASPRSQKRL